MNCPKCNGKIVAYTSATESDRHCLICGYYIMPTPQIVMPGIPQMPERQKSYCVAGGKASRYNKQTMEVKP